MKRGCKITVSKIRRTGNQPGDFYFIWLMTVHKQNPVDKNKFLDKELLTIIPNKYQEYGTANRARQTALLYAKQFGFQVINNE